jgi:hypothetical protein
MKTIHELLGAQGESPREQKSDSWGFSNRGLQSVPLEQHATCRLGGDRRRRMRALREQRHFPERAPDALGVDDMLTAARSAYDANRPFYHNPPPARRATREKEHGVRRKAHFHPTLGQRGDYLRRSVAEKWERCESIGGNHLS